MAPAVSLREAVALAGRFPLLTGASLEVEEGEVVHVRGPNGAGKTSLLRLCCGLVPLHSGEGSVLGYDLSVDARPLRRSVGLLGHQSFLYEELTVEENARYALRAAGAPVSAWAGVGRLFGLDGRLATTQVGRLSAGQRRRSALAILVARAPRLWLLDEPHAGLDQEARDLLDEMLSSSATAGRTVLFCSHEHDRAGLVADRVVEMLGGQMVEERVRVA